MGECCFLRIVISSEVEKSSWQTDKRRARKQRKASLRRRLRRSASVMHTAVQERSRAPLGMTIRGKTYFSKRVSGPRLAPLGSPFQRKGLGCRFLRIVISCEVEKSYWQTDKRCARKQRKASLRRRLRRSASVMHTAVQERSRAPLGMTIRGKTYFSKRVSGPRLAPLGSPFQRKGLGCRFLRIVISSEVEKSSLQTDKRRASGPRLATLVCPFQRKGREWGEDALPVSPTSLHSA